MVIRGNLLTNLVRLQLNRDLLAVGEFPRRIGLIHKSARQSRVSGGEIAVSATYDWGGSYRCGRAKVGFGPPARRVLGMIDPNGAYILQPLYKDTEAFVLPSWVQTTSRAGL